MNNEAQAELPRYVSHKEVWAIKILGVSLDPVDGSSIITPERGSGFGPFRTKPGYDAKHDPKAGGYYVRYKDGYESWSPADVFESGYTRVN